MHYPPSKWPWAYLKHFLLERTRSTMVNIYVMTIYNDYILVNKFWQQITTSIYLIIIKLLWSIKIVGLSMWLSHLYEGSTFKYTLICAHCNPVTLWCGDAPPMSFLSLPYQTHTCTPTYSTLLASLHPLLFTILTSNINEKGLNIIWGCLLICLVRRRLGP
jgi:hypothetical protein